ncbi:MAG: TonB-dependent receptor [Candidatus Marinimicrobia bacterium]|nr:TonB-dependent receptor [Candidatus Neomarinimicrobiota bacterium]
MKNTIYCTTIFLILFCFLVAQEKTYTMEELSRMTIRELMNIKVGVNSKKELPIHQAPAIITVIWDKDIQNSGLRDLREVLEHFVPGFQFASGQEGSIGMSVRGMWANDGKMLLLIDGLECNDEMFATLFFGNHYTVDNIKKIEVSRGPGSAIYGGYAGLSVINVITKNFEDKYVSASYSAMSERYAQRGLNLNYGQQFKDFSYHFSSSLAQGVRSQRNNVDYHQNSMAMKGNSDIHTVFINTNIRYKELEIRGIADIFHYEQIDLWGINYSKALHQKNDTYMGSVSYKFDLNPKHKITPKIIFKYQKPWHLHVPDKNYINSKFITKYTTGLVHNWDVNSDFSIITGFEYFNTILNLPENHKEYEEIFKNNTNQLSVENYSIFSQAIALNKNINITLGGRWDYSSEYGQSFVPRIALTKTLRRVHFKTMISQSFRIPGGIIPNRIPREVEGIEPEKATNYEFETGYSSDNFYMGINAFSITFDKYIVYGSDPATGIGTYMNSGKLGTQGIESELKYNLKNINFMVNYAFYTTTDLEVRDNLVPVDEDFLLAFARHRINSMVHVKVTDNISLGILTDYFGKRYSYTHFDGIDDVLTEFKPEWLLHTNLKITHLLNTNLDAHLGVNNVLNAELPFLQPYVSHHAPIPSLSRSFSIKLMYHF